jgi:hypothetical protein
VIAAVTPDGWSASGPISLALPASATATARFSGHATCGLRRAPGRIAVDVTIDGRRFGQQAEALLSANYVT